MKTLGIYFGPKAISLVESDGQKLLNSALIPLQRLSGMGEEEKVPEEIKIVAALKDKFRKSNIESKEANLVLLGRDLIIRTFHMPMLPANEVFTAVRFEAKKYIPFKLEELVYDFQVFLDKANRRNLVLFVGIKRENIEKYTVIFNQLNIKINSIEYSGFSILRLIQLAKLKEKGVCAVVDIDLLEEDEINFVVLENGFPLFSRDIVLNSEPVPPEGAQPVKTDFAPALEKLKVELRISLDFYLRKFPTKNIGSILLIAPENYRNELELFVRERGIEPKFVDSRRFLDRPVDFSLGLFKAYAVNLGGVLKSDIKIDLLPAKIKAKGLERVAVAGPVLFGFVFDSKIFLLAIAIVAIPFLISFYRLKPLQSDLASLLNSRPPVLTVNPDLSLNELKDLDVKYKENVRVIKATLKGMVLITGQLDSIPRIMPEGLWLNDFNFRRNDNGEVLTVSGSCYLGDNDKERKLINKFLNDLKENENFNKIFKVMNILNLDQGQNGNFVLTNFVIECRGR
ncbi:MAG: pilus assembly protein PilM [Candidatus Omnitrophota bacterium]